MRAHSILLSNRRYTIPQIAAIYEVHRDTVADWLAAWAAQGEAGLHDQPRSGRPPSLTPAEQETARTLLRATPRSIKTALARLHQQTGKEISASTLKRLARRADMRWKRVRKSLKGKRDAAEFAQAEQELAILQQKQAAGDLDLRYFDEVGFTLTPVVPYAWQTLGTTLEIPSARSKRLNVLGFYNTDNEFTSFTVTGTVNTATVIQCFDAFCATLQQPTVVVIDNASVHTSAAFTAQLDTWAAQGLQVKYLPTYAPELNLIEILWRFIKYSWLPFTAYNSFADLRKALKDVLNGIGSKYQVTFA